MTQPEGLDITAPPNGAGWVHLRMCQSCGHVDCCDNSPGRLAIAHFGSTRHPLIRSF